MRANIANFDSDLLYFIYSSPAVTTAAVASAAASEPIKIASDADFHAHYFTVSIEQAGALVGTYAGLIQIEDSSAGRTFFNAPMSVAGIAGTGEFPYELPFPRMILANSTLIVTVSNPAGAAVATTVRLSIHGYKTAPNIANQGR